MPTPKCNCGACRTCKQREYMRTIRAKLPARPKPQQKLDALDLKALEVWARHKPAEQSGVWRSTMSLIEDYADPF